MGKKQIQQGDVIIKEIDTLPVGVKPDVYRDSGKIIIAKGEASGHDHVIESDGAELWEIQKGGAIQKYLKVSKPVTIYHDEHKPLPIPVGIYEIGRVLEYDYVSMVEHIVND